MKEVKAKDPHAARKRPAAENEFLILRELMTGEFLKGSISVEKSQALADKGLPTDIQKKLRQWEADGTVAGYAPVLSEKGLSRYKALETLYGDDGFSVDKDAVGPISQDGR